MTIALTTRQTLRTVTTTAGEQVDTASGWNPSMIPSAWVRRGVLARPLPAGWEPEKFAFYTVADDRVAVIQFHPMNGWDDLSVRVLPSCMARKEWLELLAGEGFEHREATGCGRLNVRKGRYAKARRTA